MSLNEVPVPCPFSQVTKTAVLWLIIGIGHALRKDRAQFAEGETRKETAGLDEISDVCPESINILSHFYLTLNALGGAGGVVSEEVDVPGRT